MDQAICSAIQGWFPPPHGYEGVRNTFGDIAVSGDQLVGPTWWEGSNMTTVAELPGCPHPLYINKKVLPMLREALLECEALDDGFEIKTIGCFAPRGKRANPRMLSMHSWGIAVDINAEDNKMVLINGPFDLARRSKTIPDAWIAIFKSIGWTWGGDFQGIYDPMHVQFCSGC